MAANESASHYLPATTGNSRGPGPAQDRHTSKMSHSKHQTPLDTFRQHTKRRRPVNDLRLIRGLYTQLLCKNSKEACSQASSNAAQQQHREANLLLEQPVESHSNSQGNHCREDAVQHVLNYQAPSWNCNGVVIPTIVAIIAPTVMRPTMLATYITRSIMPPLCSCFT